MYITTLTDITPLLNSYENNGSFFENALALVPKYRREKIERLHTPKDKCRSLAAGLLLNYSIGRFFSCGIEAPPLQIMSPQMALDYYNRDYNFDVAAGEHGKPYFINRPDIFFNLSHSGNYAVCVISDKDCGIDIEDDRNMKLSVAKRFFSEREYLWITDANDDSEQKSRFFRIWTLKEAYAKVTGNGIANEIANVEYIADSLNNSLKFSDSCLNEKYMLMEYSYNSSRIAAIIKN